MVSPKSPESWYWAGQVEVLIASTPQTISYRAEIPLLQEPTELAIDDRAIAGLRWTPKKWFTSQLVTVWGDPIERRVLAEVPLVANESNVPVPIQGRFTLDRLRFAIDEAFVDGWVGVYTTTGQPLYESTTPAAWATAGVEVVSAIGREFDSPTFFLASYSSSASGRVRVIFEGY